MKMPSPTPELFAVLAFVIAILALTAAAFYALS